MQKTAFIFPFFGDLCLRGLFINSNPQCQHPFLWVILHVILHIILHGCDITPSPKKVQGPFAYNAPTTKRANKRLGGNINILTWFEIASECVVDKRKM